MILARLKQGAKRRNIPFSLTKADIPDDFENCPVFPWIKLVYAVGQGASLGSVSIDRILNDRGYESGNIEIMSYRANTLKGDASLEELVALGKWAKKKLDKLKSKSYRVLGE